MAASRGSRDQRSCLKQIALSRTVSSWVYYVQVGDAMTKRIVALVGQPDDGTFAQRVLGTTPDGDVLGAFAPVPKKQ